MSCHEALAAVHNQLLPTDLPPVNTCKKKKFLVFLSFHGSVFMRNILSARRLVKTTVSVFSKYEN